MHIIWKEIFNAIKFLGFDCGGMPLTVFVFVLPLMSAQVRSYFRFSCKPVVLKWSRCPPGRALWSTPGFQTPACPWPRGRTAAPGPSSSSSPCARWTGDPPTSGPAWRSSWSLQYGTPVIYYYKSKYPSFFPSPVLSYFMLVILILLYTCHLHDSSNSPQTTRLLFFFFSIPERSNIGGVCFDLCFYKSTVRKNAFW